MWRAQPLALRAYERALELGLKLDSQFQVLNNMGILLTSMGRPADAVETFEKAAALTSGDAASDGKPAAGTATDDDDGALPPTADMHYYRGQALNMLGRTADAERAYQQSLAVDRTFAKAYAGLIAVRRDSEANPVAWRELAAEMESVLERLGRSHADDPHVMQEKASLEFSLWAVHHNLGDFATAWTHVRAGNELERLRRPKADARAEHMNRLQIEAIFQKGFWPTPPIGTPTARAPTPPIVTTQTDLCPRTHVHRADSGAYPRFRRWHDALGVDSGGANHLGASAGPRRWRGLSLQRLAAEYPG